VTPSAAYSATSATNASTSPVPPRAPPRFLFHSSPRDHDGRRRSGSAFVRAGGVSERVCARSTHPDPGLS
jgi:hypothetical protein